jgi:hypothetical protein
MSDTGPSAEALDAAATQAPPAAAAPPAEPPVKAAEPEGEWYTDPDKVQSYVKELRDEAAANRVKAKPFAEVFDGYSPEETKYLLDVLRAASSSDEAARKKAGDEFVFLAKQMGVTVGEAVDAAADAAKDAMSDTTDQTPAPEPAAPSISPEDVNAQIRQALQEQENARQVQTEVQRIQSTITEAGYELFGPDYDAIVGQARRHGYSIEEAIEKHKESRQAQIDGFVQDQRGRGSRFPSQSGTGGTPPPGGGEAPEWLGDSKKTNDAVRDWLRSRAGQG